MEPTNAAVGQLLQTARPDSDDIVGDVIAAAREHLEADITFLAEFRGDREVVRRAIGLDEGVSFPLAGSYCQRVVDGALPSAVADARRDARVKDLAITKQLDIGAYVGVPVRLPDGQLFGTLCSIRHEADPSLRERDVKFMRVLADLIGTRLGREAAAAAQRRAKVARIQALLAGDQLQMVFQPIVDLRTGATAGVEALARFDAEPRRPPDQWFSEAREVGLAVELETAAIRKAVAQLPGLPDSLYMSVNASPDTVLSATLRQALAEVPPGRLVIEITEHDLVGAYEPLMASIAALQNIGMRIAVDDVGAGYSGLHHILRVSPRLLKLDMILTRGLHGDPAKRAMTSAVVYFAARTGMTIVAEGIETREDAETLRVLEVPYGQGYYFAKPGPLHGGIRFP